MPHGSVETQLPSFTFPSSPAFAFSQVEACGSALPRRRPFVIQHSGPNFGSLGQYGKRSDYDSHLAIVEDDGASGTWPRQMREEPRLSGPFVIKWVDFYANSSENGLLVEQHVPLAGDSQTNSRKALVEVPLLAATQIDRDRFPTFSYFYNSSEWERARFAYVRVELDINHNWTEFSSRSTTVHSLGVFEWTAARLYVPHKIRCRTYVWRDGRLVCRVLEAEGTRTSFDGKDGEVRWIYTFEFVSFYFQLMFDVAWASDALRPAHETLREELQQLSVLQAFFEERPDGSELPLLCVMYEFAAAAGNGGIEFAKVPGR